MRRNGKIARLPKNVREELNCRIENNESGKILVDWLNSLPEVQQITNSEFEGKPIREQNLSEWKKGGYRDWEALRQKRELILKFEEIAKDSGSHGQITGIQQYLSLILSAELAQALEDLNRKEMDAEKKVSQLSLIVRRFVQLRREESNASRAEIEREEWAAELSKKKESKRLGGTFMPLQALLLQQMYIDTFSAPGARSFIGPDDLSPGESE